MKIEEGSSYCGGPNGARGEATHIFSDPTGETDRLAYPSGRTAVVRSAGTLLDVQLFGEHNNPVTCCRFAPKDLIASGDEGGTVRVWNPKTMKQREELGLVGDAIRDVAFTDDMKFMAFASDYRGCFSKVVKYPGCGSAGSITGHTKRVTSIDIRSGPKPAIITGGDDMISGFYLGPPVRDSEMPKIKRQHTNFVLDARFSPDGSKYATTSTDRSIFIIDAETHDEMKLEGHSGSVTGVAWNKDGTKIITSSTDKTAKVWDVSSGQCIYTIVLGTGDFNDMQVGCAWIHKTNQLVSASLRGEIFIFEEGDEEPRKVLRGHSKAITGLTNVGSNVYTIDFSGLCVYTAVGDEECKDHFHGKGHQNAGKCIAANKKIVVSAGVDGNVFLTPIDTLEYPKKPILVKGGCTDLACPGEDAPYAAMIINDSKVTIVGHDETITELLTFDRSETGASVAVTDDGLTVVVSVEIRGGAGKTLCYKYDKGKLEKFGDAIQGPSSANRMKITSDGKTLIVGEKSRQVRMYDIDTQVKVSGGGACHTGIHKNIHPHP